MNVSATKMRIEHANRHERLVKAILLRNATWPCVYPGCANKGIFSHAISESISLATIAENGHLVAIESRRRGDTKALNFGLQGTRDATAFNGFCGTHDALFTPLDTREISTTENLFLQAYRSVTAACTSEIRLATLWQDSLQKADVEELLEPHLEEHPWLKQEESKALFLSDCASMADSHGQRTKALLSLPTELLATISAVAAQTAEPLKQHGVARRASSSHGLIYRRLPFPVPVALNDILPRAHGARRLDFFFTIVPYERSALIVGLFPKTAPIWLLERLFQRFDDDAAALDLVESLLACCNQWFMTPSVHDAIPAAKREVLLQDTTCFHEQQFQDVYDMTLFDALRRDQAQQHLGSAPQWGLDRTATIPAREDFAHRHRRMLETLISQFS